MRCTVISSNFCGAACRNAAVAGHHDDQRVDDGVQSQQFELSPE
jgi:hypothetical protein